MSVWVLCVCVFLTSICPCSALQINAFQASMVLFIGKAWGAVTDPIVGFFITKSRWTKIGRLMPWWAPCLHYEGIPWIPPSLSFLSLVSYLLFPHLYIFHWEIFCCPSLLSYPTTQWIWNTCLFIQADKPGWNYPPFLTSECCCWHTDLLAWKTVICLQIMKLV